MDANIKSLCAIDVGRKFMKKIVLCLAFLVLTGCTNGEEVSCDNNGNKEVYTLNNGLVESLTIDGKKQSQDVIDELNGTYFTSTTTNEEAKEVLNDYIASMGGSCQ